jgi:hypothetical protein
MPTMCKMTTDCAVSSNCGAVRVIFVGGGRVCSERHTVAAARRKSSDLHSLVWQRSHVRTSRQTQTKAREMETETTIRPRLSLSVMTNGAGMTPATMVREGRRGGASSDHAREGDEGDEGNDGDDVQDGWWARS